MEAKGKTIIRITSVIFILVGLISTFTFLIPTILGGMFTAETSGVAQTTGLLVTGMFFTYLMWSVFQLITGIVGFKNAGKVEKAGQLVTLGVILIIVSLINGVLGIIGDGFSIQTVISIVAGLCLPVLYVYGAKQNQKY